MTHFLQQLISGIGTGAIYASLALALVFVFRTTHVINIAQGEIAMFSTFLAWQLVQGGLHIWVAILLAMVASFVIGVVVERLLIRPIEGGEHLNIVVITIGLLLLFNQAAGWIWKFLVKDFPSPFPSGVLVAGEVRITYESVSLIVVLGLVSLALYLLFQHTKLGLAMRVAASNPESSRLVGISVSRMTMMGWGIAAALGALAGAMAAAQLFLEPNMMQGVMLYAFAAATLGGFDSPLGAVVGGIIVGVSENLAGTYVDFIGSDLKLLVPLFLIFAVLLLKPSGLFGRPEIARV